MKVDKELQMLGRKIITGEHTCYHLFREKNIEASKYLSKKGQHRHGFHTIRNIFGGSHSHHWNQHSLVGMHTDQEEFGNKNRGERICYIIIDQLHNRFLKVSTLN